VLRPSAGSAGQVGARYGQKITNKKQFSVKFYSEVKIYGEEEFSFKK
jgi:hypothetical protein